MSRYSAQIFCAAALLLGQADAHSRDFDPLTQAVTHRLRELYPQNGGGAQADTLLDMTLSQVDGAGAMAPGPGGMPDGGMPAGGMGNGLVADNQVGQSAEESDDAACNAVTDEEFCAADGSDNFSDIQLVYDSSTGMFNGTIITNQCNKVAIDQTLQAAEFGAVSCIQQDIPSVTELPSSSPQLGGAGWTFFGENIYSALENGFDEGIVDCENAFCDRGLTIMQCAEQLFATCTVLEDGVTELNLLNECGGHANPYHYHEDLVCHYDPTAPGHSTIIGFLLDGRGMYGRFEDTDELPKLDACNGHFGTVPANETLGVESTCVYHYHVTENAPFMAGCYGPVASVAECQTLYNVTNMACLDGTSATLQADMLFGESETVDIDLWCSCYQQDPETLASCTPGDFYPPAGSAASPADAPNAVASPTGAPGTVTTTDGAASPAEGPSATAETGSATETRVIVGLTLASLGALALAA